MNKGYLDVSPDHKLYFEEWGNPKGVPIFYIHGGPGSNFSESSKLTFNPNRHKVIFHDQRGCGKSLPFAETKNNTTQDLIEDIEKLADHLEIKKFAVVGGSWGSTLSLLYAIEHPERVSHLVMWGIYLARQFETDFVNEGYPRYTFPEEWERFISLVPEKNRKNGDSIMKYYAQQIRSKNKSTAKKYADEWTLWEAHLMTIDHDSRRLEQEVLSVDNMAIAHLETHYFLNKCFIPENYILDNIAKIKHIPCNVVQGRFDYCTPPITAVDLAKAYGNNLALQFVNSGHLRTEPQTLAALQAIVNDLK